ncbi:LysR family transcriptional regulator [Robertmurraya massiliosenegalensis]|uniref:LysR family transcriptional regulator n=1 Tax=Robertmurraya massiliosenegalensis TaxID=1287657 RepID=UPI000317358D|nr:LysR family transcriptional regulator [Robertmurraya massiliosenegalensis]
MELRDLKYFKSVCDTGSFTKAGQVLHISQPTITKAVHRLEEEIGVQLFDRNKSSKQITLTPEGQIFLLKVEGILDYIDESVVAVQNFQNKKIRLGLPPIIGAAVFPPIYEKLVTQFHSLQFEIQENGTNDMRSLIKKGQVDLGFIYHKCGTEPPDLKYITLHRDELKVCVSKDHPFAHLKKIALEDLQWERFILLSESYLHNYLVLSECKKHGYIPDITFTSNEVVTVKSLVETGLGITILSNMAIKENQNIVPLSLEDPVFLDVLLCWKKDHILSPECQQVIDYISHQFKKEKETNNFEVNDDEI